MNAKLHLECLEARDVPATVAQAVTGYMATHTAQQLQEEYWNLLGLRPNAYITDANRGLADAFGIDTRGYTALSKAYVMKWTTAAELRAIREEIADTLAADPRLGEAQRLFLEWNYRADPLYAAVLEHGRTAVVGWDRAHTFAAGGDWTAYTFPLLGCTAVIAWAPDGAGHFSHYKGVVNPAQVGLLAGFLDAHPGATVAVVGISAVQVAREIAFLPNPPAQILTHVKPQYMESAYWVRASWRGGSMSVDIERRPADGRSYLESCLISLNPAVIFDYPAGRTWEAMPGEDADFRPAELFRYTAVISGSWRDSLGNTVEVTQSGRSLVFTYNGQASYQGAVGWLNQVVFTDPATGAATVAGKLCPRQDKIRFDNGVIFTRA